MRSSSAPLTNSQVFALPSMAPVRKALDDEFDRYIARHKASLSERNHRRWNLFRFSAVRSQAALFP